mgnify:FL=1
MVCAIGLNSNDASIACLKAASMTCCVVALALAMQIIEAWRRVKSWFGIQPRETVASHGFGTVMANFVTRVRHPYVRYAVFTALMLEGASAGAWVYGHRAHVGNEISAAVFESTGFALALCDGDPATAVRHW